MAYLRRQPEAGLIVHSDRGSQYCGHAFQNAMRAYKMQSSMSRKGDCWDNAPTESLWGHLKVARLHGRRFATRREAMDEVMDWLGFYNSTRLHQTLGYVSPMTFEMRWFAAVFSKSGMSLKPPQKAARRNESNRCRRRQCIGDFSHHRGGLWASGRRARAVGNACVVHGPHPVRRQAHRPLVHSPCRARSARPPPSAHALGLHHLGACFVPAAHLRWAATSAARAP